MPRNDTDVPGSPPARVAPLIPLALAMAAGICVDRFAAPLETSTWIVVGAVLAALGGALGRHGRLGVAALLLAWVAVGGGRHHQFWHDLPADDLARIVDEETRPAWIRGVLIDVLGHRQGLAAGQEGLTRSILEISHVHDRGDWRVATGRVLLIAAGDRSDLRAGMVVEAAGGLGLVAPPLNPGEFDESDYLRSRGARLRFAADGASGVWRVEGDVPGGPRWACIRALGEARGWSQSTLATGLGPASAPLATALLLGRREGVAPEVNDAFARTGTTHLLAISGLHLQVVGVALGWSLRLLGFSRRTAFATVALATVGYAGLVGLMPSVVRSAAMTLTGCAAGLLRRPVRSGSTMAAAAMLTLVLNPSHLFDAGCQLSFLAVGVIVWGLPPVMAWLFREPDALTRLEWRFAPTWTRVARRFRVHLAQGVAISTVVWLAALPLVAWRFHLVSPISILMNLPLVPMTSLALLAGGVFLGLSAVGAPGAGAAAWLCSALLDATERILAWGVAQQWGHAFVPGPPWWLVALFYGAAGLAAVSAARGWRCRTIALMFTSAIIPLVLAWTFGHGPWPWRVPPEAEVLAVGHGLAVVIDPGDGRATLYDCGRMRDPTVGRRIVAPALWSRGIRALDAVIISHADADHYAGLPDLLDRFSVDLLILPVGFVDGEAPDPGAVALLREVRRRGVPIQEMSAGGSWRSGPFQFEVIHPSGVSAFSETDNERSLVLDVAAPGGRLLLTGDLEGPGLADLPGLLRDAPLDVMLAPHHGGGTANPPWLYEEANPRLVVVSQRAPADGVRDPLANLGRPVLRAWELGAVRLTWTAAGVSARGYLERGNQAAKGGRSPGGVDVD